MEKDVKVWEEILIVSDMPYAFFFGPGLVSKINLKNGSDPVFEKLVDNSISFLEIAKLRIEVEEDLDSDEVVIKEDPVETALDFHTLFSKYKCFQKTMRFFPMPTSRKALRFFLSIAASFKELIPGFRAAALMLSNAIEAGEGEMFFMNETMKEIFIGLKRVIALERMKVVLAVKVFKNKGTEYALGFWPAGQSSSEATNLVVESKGIMSPKEEWSNMGVLTFFSGTAN